MEKIINMLQEFLPYLLAWGGGIISVLVGALLNHRLTQERERQKWLMENLIASLKKSTLLIKKLDKLHRHYLPREIDQSGKIVKIPGELGELSMLSEEPGEKIEVTMDRVNSKEDYKVATELCAEIETEVNFLIINCNRFKRTKILAQNLQEAMEKSRQNNQLIIEGESRKNIIKILNGIFCSLCK
ncbi:hypothetical protein [Laspinema olomoucense]|uniref:hypothetical protein n=1 Tax=Laspinema olomoucense TaxID=3231600 RepID=UPI0021BA98A1|nr:hypothetical protein [Laspinema sp. D3d]MCT7971122.1 hypothetical protein [Laspinema sp. D3d]